MRFMSYTHIYVYVVNYYNTICINTILQVYNKHIMRVLQTDNNVVRYVINYNNVTNTFVIN